MTANASTPEASPLMTAVAGLANLIEEVDAERANGIWRFFDTVDAYNATQCNEDIKNGDVLIIEGDSVVGFLVDAWPVAITEAHGELHALREPAGDWRNGDYLESAVRAAKIAREMGFAIHPANADLGTEEAPAEPEDVIRVSVRSYRGTGPLATVHVNCPCPLKTTLRGTYATLAEAEKAAADHRQDAPHRRCKLSAPLRAADKPQFVSGQRVLCPDGTARTVVGMFQVPNKPPQVCLEGGGSVDASACTLVDTSRIEEARKTANLAAERVRANPDPCDEMWRRALNELTEALRYLEHADPMYAEAIAGRTERITVEVPRTHVIKGDIIHAMGARLTVLDHGTTSSGARGLPRWWADVLGVEESDRKKTYRTAWTLAVNLGDAAWDEVTVERAVPAPAFLGRRPQAAGYGSAPRHAGHPDVIAARELLRPLRPATLADDTEVTEPHEADPEVRGYMLEPRGPGRVAAYWIEGGRAVTADDGWHGPSLLILADKLRMAGWDVTNPRPTGMSVFAQRPADH